MRQQGFLNFAEVDKPDACVNLQIDLPFSSCRVVMSVVSHSFKDGKQGRFERDF